MVAVGPRVAGRYDSLSPALLRLLHFVVEKVRPAGVDLAVCGEMAGEILFTPLLLGLGMDELSAGTSLVPRVKSAVQRLSVTECQKLVKEVLELDTPAAVLARCTEMATRQYGELIG
jgi:phosphotransferase system enzyme I (PtsI)